MLFGILSGMFVALPSPVITIPLIKVTFQRLSRLFTYASTVLGNFYLLENFMSNKHKRPGTRLGLLLLSSVISTVLAGGAQAASEAKISAKGKFDNTTGNLLVIGAVKGVTPGSQVMMFDAGSKQLLYSTKTNGKNKFSISIPADKNSLCKINLQVGNAQLTAAIIGANASCKTAPSCAIDEGDQKIAVNGTLTFTTKAAKTGKASSSFSWYVSDNVPSLTSDAQPHPSATGNTLSHQFKYPGLYRVSLTGSNSGGTCSDEVMVSVEPSGAPASVDSLASAARSSASANASALNAEDGGYVVLPYEETGMQGGSQIHLPYNAMINYNSLNAQVVKKDPHKPPLVSSSSIDVTYAASVNPNDPVGNDSINTTSQNWFSDNSAGGNTDLVNSTVDPTTQAPTSNVFVPGHDFSDAVIRKSEQWDRLYQKNRTTQTGTDFAWQQNRFTPAKPLANPDEGVRGNIDMGAGVRAMPGIAAPYNANDPQPFGFNDDQNSFAAQFIPASNIDDKGRVNPYPVMRVEARSGGNTVAKTDAVYTTASETRCRECHLPGGIAADDEVWRTPVNEAELLAADGTSPGPATGAGSFDSGLDATKAWPPAIHNRFDDSHPDNSSFTNLGVTIPRDANNLRADRVSESRWVKLDANGNPTDEVSATKPADATGWRLQLKIKFKSGADYGDANDPVAQEKAALFNTLLMHDYMVLYGPTPATGKNWPASYSSQLADAYSDDDVGKSAAKPMYFCSGHHQSQLKFDVGIAAKTAATNRSDYSRAFHAFHGKMQVYKEDVDSGADGKVHKKGELIRNSRGHPLMLGGRGWDSQLDDDNGVPLKKQSDSTFADNSALKGSNYTQWDSKKFTVPTYDPSKNNWRPDLYPMHSKGQLMLQTDSQLATQNECVICHSGNTEKSYRDIHHAAGLQCESCHGGMLAVGNVYANEGYDANLSFAGAMGKDTATNGEPADFRRPWLDEPDCGSCHIGDANLKSGDIVDSHALSNVFSAGALKQAWKDGDQTGYSTQPLNARFAVMPHTEQRLEKYTLTQTDIDGGAQGKVGDTTYMPQPLSQALYRKSGDVHGSGANGTLTCSTCHGGSHAIWPNPDPNANDNVTAKQLQGYDGNIAECSVCHAKDDFKTGLVATDGGSSNLGVGQGVRDGTVVTPANAKAYLAGPHGLHPVNDESWWKNATGVQIDDFRSKVGNGGWHSDMAYKTGPDGEDQCAACHGADHKGTRLSKTLTARDFVTDKGKKIHVDAGQVIGCNLCHTMAVSFNRAPDPKAVDGGWPKAQLHQPSMPESISPSAGSTDSGGHSGH
jgi:hypothetical protein